MAQVSKIKVEFIRRSNWWSYDNFRNHPLDRGCTEGGTTVVCRKSVRQPSQRIHMSVRKFACYNSFRRTVSESTQGQLLIGSQRRRSRFARFLCGGYCTS